MVLAIAIAAALIELIMIIGQRMVIRERDAEIVILKNVERTTKELLRKRRELPTDGEGVYTEMVETGDIHGAD